MLMTTTTTANLTWGARVGGGLRRMACIDQALGSGPLAATLRCVDQQQRVPMHESAAPAPHHCLRLCARAHDPPLPPSPACDAAPTPPPAVRHPFLLRRQVRNLLEVLSELEPQDQRRFLRFVTGCPRLPPGGLAALQPRLTVVRKQPRYTSRRGLRNMHYMTRPPCSCS